ncbi:MAG: hypothetical protein DSY82_06555 [Flavobacteriia bacterium]|nr:MAG: hypothetical protein DSY82_06555 [Flavobacteriia bacterium]
MNQFLMFKYYSKKITEKIIKVILLSLISVLMNTVSGQEGVDHWETVFYEGANFSYFTNNDGTAANNWRELQFDDSSWKTGAGGIGYGDNDDKTVIDQCISVFMRTKFQIADKSVIERALLHIDYDDAFVAYLNGVEIARSEGLEDSPPAQNQLSSSNHEAKMYQGGKPEVFEIDQDILGQTLKTGDNVIAIQLHNLTATSSDMTSRVYFSVGLTTSDHPYNDVPEWFYIPWTFEGSTLPLMIIDTDGHDIPDEPKITATMKLINNGDGQINHPDDPANEYNGLIGIEIRGSSSAGYPQKPYSLETRDESGEDLDVSLLGMPKESDWVLISHYNEKTFMRNPLSYWIFEAMGHYSIRWRLVDVMLNGSYDGIYLFAEKVKRDKNRININKLKKSETSGVNLTGGYIFKTDYVKDYDSWLSDYSPFDHPDYKTRFVYYYPKWNKIVDEQKAYIKTAVDAFQKALHLSDFGDTYSNYIDESSFIDYFIVNEVSRNIDGFKKSRYYHKDRDDINNLIFAGPVWDFDWAWKNINDCEETRNTTGAGWCYKTNDCRVTNTPGWYVRLLQDETFANKVHCRYKKLREGVLSLNSIYKTMDSIYNLVKEPQKNHFKRWDVLGVRTGAPELEPPAETYEEEVQRLKNWIATRLTWLDQNMVGSGDHCDALAVEKFDLVKLRLFPNPVHTRLYIEAVHPVDRIEIFDQFGRKVMDYEGKDRYSNTLRISNLSQGLYFVRISFDKGEIVKVKKLLIE